MKATSRCADNEGRQLTNVAEALLGKVPICLESGKVGQELQAGGYAALGDATVTVRATSGSIVHTLDLPISVADQLPFC
jgi:hypothetical protein